MRSVAYALPAPTLAMMVIKTCSLMENGPGLIEMPKTSILGSHLAHARPIGKDNSWATIYQKC